MKRLLCIMILGLMAAVAAAQPAPVQVPQYDIVRYDANSLHYDTASQSLNDFFRKWHRLVQTRQGNINIVHIGGSHVQAGTMSNTVRTNIMKVYPELVSGRGMLFPYSAAARCNNPPDYRIHCPQKVSLTRNIYKDYPYPLGLCGISITASHVLTEVGVEMNEPDVDYSTSRIVILGHSDENVVPRLRISDRTIFPSYVDKRTDRFVFNLNRPTDSFTIVLPCRAGQHFTLTGVLLDNRKQGFSFHSIGVNGASVPDYLRCEHFTRDLRLLHPDLVIFGIGINDAMPTVFDTAAFRQNYLRLVDSIRSVNPDCAFIFITNNDSYRKIRRHRYSVNTNGILARKVFYRLAEDVGGAVWDQFEVMGGLRSMEKWYKQKLAQADRVHFTRAGYQLVGNLFTNALFEAVSDYNRRYPNQKNKKR